MPSTVPHPSDIDRDPLTLERNKLGSKWCNHPCQVIGCKFAMPSVRVQTFHSIPGGGIIKRLTVIVPQQEKEGTLKGVNDESLLEGLFREEWVQ